MIFQGKRAMLRILLVHPGSTDFDEQGRIKGTLDVPLNANGASQVARTVDELMGTKIDLIYASPCVAAKQTATVLGADHDVKVKVIEKLQNLDHGLWHGKRIEEVKKAQPRIYKQGQDRPETVVPPHGEPLEAAQKRVHTFLGKLLKRHNKGVVAIVLPDPILSLARSYLQDVKLGNLWKSECDQGGWEVIDMRDRSLESTA